MSDIFKCVEKLLNDNGVRVYVEELQLNHPDDMKCVRIEKKILTLDFSEHDKVFEDEIERLKRNLDLQKDKRLEVETERNYLKERITELESKETETCEKEPIPDDCRPSIEWYENRHQSDCIEINRLNTTIDVLIHKVEYLRQFAGLE